MARSVTAAALRLVTAAAAAASASVISRPSPTLARMISTASCVFRPSRTPLASGFQTCPPSFIFNRRYGKRRLQDSDDSDFEPKDLDSDLDSYEPGTVKYSEDDDEDFDDYSDEADDVDE